MYLNSDLQKRMNGPGVLENINDLWIDVKKDGNNVWKIAGVRELTKFESDWAPGEPQNDDNGLLNCAYMSRAEG